MTEFKEAVRLSLDTLPHDTLVSFAVELITGGPVQLEKRHDGNVAWVLWYSREDPDQIEPADFDDEATALAILQELQGE